MNAISYDYAARDKGDQHPSRTIRFLAHLISIIFHPLLITLYVFLFLIYLHPSAFEGVDPKTKTLRLLSLVLFTIFFPAFSLFVAWRLKLIKNMQLEHRQDRLVGFIITMFFFFWASYVFRNLPDTPRVAAHFILGTFLAVCGAWMCTIFYKISLHAVAMGGLVAFALLFGREDAYVSGLYLTIPVLLAGFVCTARLILGAHNRFELVTGFIVGILAQWIAWFF